MTQDFPAGLGVSAACGRPVGGLWAAFGRPDYPVQKHLALGTITETTADASRTVLRWRVSSDLPLVGARVEQLFANLIRTSLDADQAFTRQHQQDQGQACGADAPAWTPRRFRPPAGQPPIGREPLAQPDRAAHVFHPQQHAIEQAGEHGRGHADHRDEQGCMGMTRGLTSKTCSIGCW